MTGIIAWAISFVIALVLFLPCWKRIGPAVYKATASHAVQIIAMIATFAVLFGIAGVLLSAAAGAL